MKEKSNESKPLAYSYVRMSTTAQMKGDSLRRQSDPARKYALENGLTLVEDFDLKDIGLSAYSGKNADVGELGKFIRAAEDGFIPPGSYLIMESLDRLTRQKIFPSLDLFLRILRTGINIVTLIDKQVYRAGDNDPMKVLQSISFMARAHDESEHKSNRLSESWQNKRNNANIRKLTAKAPAWLKLSRDRTTFEIHEARAAVVRRIFDDASIGLGSYAIARALNSEEVPTFGRSREWIKSSVTKILTERAVLGEFQPHKKANGKRVPVGDPIPTYYPRIVSDQVFERVRLGRTQRASSGMGRKGPTLSNLFTNLATCDYCGSPMHYINKGDGPKGGKFLKCSKAHHGAGCESKTWKYSDFETSFLYFCRELDLPELLREGARKNELAEISENIRLAEDRLTGFERQRSAFFLMLQNENIELENLITQIEEVEAKIKNEKANIRELNKKIKFGISPRIDDADVVESIALFSTALIDGDLRKRRILRQRIIDIVDSITIATNGDRSISIMQVNAELEAVKKMTDSEYESFSNSHPELDDRPFSQDSHAPLFTVTLANKVARIVVVDPRNPTKFNAIFELENGKLKVAQNWFAVDQLPGVRSFSFK